MSIDNDTNGTTTARINNPIPINNCILFSDKPPVNIKYNPATARIVGITSEYNNIMEFKIGRAHV